VSKVATPKAREQMVTEALECSLEGPADPVVLRRDSDDEEVHVVQRLGEVAGVVDR
jgi:hypothetical protein